MNNPILSGRKTFSQKKNRRKLNGILLLDKAEGITSNHALQQLKQLFQAEKAGHTGSLDPLASGMLPVCFGEATKFSQFLLESDKHYLVVAKLGVKTATGDAEGEIIAQKPVPKFSEQAIQAVLEKFRGEISQVPSMYSALKHQGQPLYKLARQGIEVERQARNVSIYSLDLVDFRADRLTLDVQCSKGTYIRTLVEDIGEILGCHAHVIYLRRLAVTPYQEQQMVTFACLEKAALPQTLDRYLLPIESALINLPRIQVSQSAVYYMKRGQPLLIPRAPASGYVCLYSESEAFLGVGEVQENGKIAPRKMLQT